MLLLLSLNLGKMRAEGEEGAETVEGQGVEHGECEGAGHTGVVGSQVTEVGWQRLVNTCGSLWQSSGDIRVG